MSPNTLKTLPHTVFSCSFAQKHKFVLIRMYGFPIAVENTKYCIRHNFHFFSRQGEMDIDVYKKMLNNQRVLQRIAKKNADRTRPQAWLRHKIFTEQPGHLSDLEFYAGMLPVLDKYNSSGLLVPKNELKPLFLLHALKQ